MHESRLLAVQEAAGQAARRRSPDPGLEVLRGPHWTARTLVAAQLGRVDDPRVVDALLLLLDDEEGLVREVAAASLGRRGDPRALAPLRELVDHERKDVVVRKAAEAAVAILERAQREG